MNDGASLQFAAGKLRLTSTPAAFWRVPATTPSGLAHGTIAQPDSAAVTRSSSRRAINSVSGSSPCSAAISRPASGGSRPGRKARSGSPSRDRPTSSTRQPSSIPPTIAARQPAATQARNAACSSGRRNAMAPFAASHAP